MKNSNEEHFMNDLLKQQWEYVYFYPDNANDMWIVWKDLFLEVLNKHAPLCHKKLRVNSVPWLTSEIKNLINSRDRLKRKAIITNLDSDWSSYKVFKNKVNIGLRNA